MAQGHNIRLKFEDRYLASPDLEGWQSREDGDEFVVWGPCPACRGPVVGPEPPDVGSKGDAPGDGELLQGEQVDEVVASIYARCNCGAEHDRKDGSGCGRYWIVEVVRP